MRNKPNYGSHIIARKCVCACAFVEIVSAAYIHALTRHTIEIKTGTCGAKWSTAEHELKVAYESDVSHNEDYKNAFVCAPVYTAV